MATKNSEIEHEEMIEMNTFKSNINTKRTRSNEPEVAIDNSCDGKAIFKILCVGDYSGRWSKGVYIQDYNSSDETIRENPSNGSVIGVDFTLKILYDKSGKRIRLQIWNIGEQERFGNMTRLYYRNAHGVIVFWGAMSQSMDSALKWKHNVSQALEPDVPFVLVVDNVFRTPKKWIGQDLVMNSLEEMDSFCLEHGFFAWFEMLERAAGGKSVFAQAMSTLVNKIISKNKTLTSYI
jgi:GTPase SAR1 family protein